MPAFPLNLEISRTTGMREARIYMKRLAEDGVTEEAVPLAGWSAFAEARKTPDQSVVVDFQPVIEPDDADGLVTLPAMSHTASATCIGSRLSRAIRRAAFDTSDCASSPTRTSR